MAAVVFLGVDPGLRATGWGLLAAERGRLAYREAGFIAPDPKLPIERRLCVLRDELARVLRRHGPAAAAVEAVFHAKNSASAIKLGQARGAALLALAEAEIPVFEYAPRAVKLAVVGSGDAAKEQVAFMVRRLLGAPEQERMDASDALAVALCHAHSVAGAGLGAERKANRTSWRRMTEGDVAALSRAKARR